MIFSSWTYVFFLAAVVILFWNVPQRFRIPLLLLASYVFYMSWSPPFGLIYGPLIFVDSLYFYGLSKAMLRWPQFKKAILITGVVSELSLLAYFKYANFLYGSLEGIFHALHMPFPHQDFNIFLPLAISFTNFILISYLVDVYRGAEQVQFSFIRFATYVSFFPHLIAGPIVRAKELLHQFEKPLKFNVSYLSKGLHLFLLGLGLKIYVADLLASYVNLIYSTPALQGFDTSWVATYSFAIQIFCDFWGYTLMAQGSASMLGYSLPENFDAPYFSLNITDFWRRWHISLSRWLKDYLYIPLGGSRGGKVGTYRNLFLTMGLGGLWHGASWNFVIWGLYQGLLLTLHKFACAFNINRLFTTITAWLLTFHAVCIGWVFFRAVKFSDAAHIISTMFNPATSKGLLYSLSGRAGDQYQALNGINALSIVVLFLAVHWTIRRYKDRFTLMSPIMRDCCVGACYFVLMYLWFSLQTQSQQFIYFQF